ncbi:MAG TPA: MFS transporter [Bacteroidia bacterium]|jgi:MFS family permease|nr:MFS transporter [Bacteroidia bacterium]
MFSFLNDYKKLELQVLNVVIAEFFIQLVNATFMNILPLYMTREGFSDEDIALYITFRFLGVFVLALPFGKLIKGKPLAPLFYLSSIFVPLFGLVIVFAIALKIKWLIFTSLLLWGASFTFMQIPVSPFILRNSSKENQTAGIALSYSTWSFGGILSGIVIAILDAINPTLFNEKAILIIFSIMGFGGIFFLLKTKFNEKIDEPAKFIPGIKPQPTNWYLIIKGLIPTLIIATGAGLTIPFISLFFDKVHHLDKGGFSIISSMAAVLVAYAAMMVPKVKQFIGYKIAIPTTQSLAVISLVALATTQFYSQYTIALYIAIACYLLRQPLMNMAGPMTTELILNYVGKNNREITSALTAAIWSGSWVISGFMVKVMFGKGFEFVNIFLITSALYAFGVVMYYLLIVDYVKREKQGFIN